MKLNEISVQTTDDYGFQKAFNRGVWCIQEMYWLQLKGTITNSIEKLVIILDKDLPNKQFGDIFTKYQSFNFEEYFAFSDYEKKKIILDLIHSTLMNLSESEGIKEVNLTNAYNYCIENNLENKWLFKNKYFISPDKKYYGGIECVWELEHFKAVGIILDKNKNELIKKELVVKEPYFGDFIYWAKCAWEDQTFYLTAKSGERWDLSI